MNFYKRYMADYAQKTAQLSLAEHGAYTLLLDELYSTEKPLPADYIALFRICRAMDKAEQTAVKSVADKYFPIDANGTRCNPRALLEITEAQRKKADSKAFWSLLAPEDRASMAARRRATEMQAVPQWLTVEDAGAIEAIYAESRALSIKTGVRHEVDHIVPLQGINVRGLHVPWNLRVVSATVNRAKGRNYG